MGRKCSVTGKSALRGHNVSHSNNRTKKVSQVNLRTKKVFDSSTGKWVAIKVSSRALRTIDRKGVAATLRRKSAK